MNWKSKSAGSMLVLVGFLLSPLSWWNDFFVNIPIALAFAWVVGFCYRPAFEAALIVGYLLTNVLGLFLIQKGAQTALAERVKKYSRRDLLKDAAISAIYTALMVVLMKLKIIAPLADYFANGK